MKEKIENEVKRFFSSFEMGSVYEYVSVNNLQQQLDNDRSTFSFVCEWNHAPRIQNITALLPKYGKKPKDIVVYGAGPVLIDAINEIKMCGLKITCFCDSDPQKHDTEMFSIPVISPKTLIEEYHDAYIIISSGRYMFNIFNQLNKMGIPADNIYIPIYEGINNINICDETSEIYDSYFNGGPP